MNAGSKTPRRQVTLFLSGDVMTGRGVDQILPHPCPPELHESYVRNALAYVELAERVNGPVPRPVDLEYIWGDALDAFDAMEPDLRIINLETAVTRSPDWAPKGINYRMHPDNIAVLTAAGIDCCVLANNHVLDWGIDGLRETLESLHGSGLRTAGAGVDLAEAEAPAVLQLPGGGRVLVFAFGWVDSGVPFEWAAQANAPGVAVLDDLSERTARDVTDRVEAYRRGDEIVVASIHWGGNWGYPVPDAHIRFAHALVDGGAADIIHGHSSHHVKGIEVYRGRPILYGCGDLLNDYEGISGYERYRGELGLMYFPSFALPGGRLLRLEMVPTRMRRLRLHRASTEETAWLRDVMDRESARLGARVDLISDGRLALHLPAG